MSVSIVEIAGVAYLLWGGRAYAVGPGPFPDWNALAQAIANAIFQIERSPDLITFEESVSTAKTYDLASGVVLRDGKKYTFRGKDVAVRADVDLPLQFNMDMNSRLTVQKGVPYTNSALREIRQITVLPTAATNVKIEVAGTNLGEVKA